MGLTRRSETPRLRQPPLERAGVRRCGGKLEELEELEELQRKNKPFDDISKLKIKLELTELLDLPGGLDKVSPRR